MLKKAIVFTILALLVTGCSSGPDDYFKRSANNKIFDRKGFRDSKRQPLYNKKYIAQAKKNILNGDYNDDEAEDEVEDPSYDNIEMYRAMIEEDLHNMNRNPRTRKKKNRNNHNEYPSLVEANDKIVPNPRNSNVELHEEITQIKSMLDEARRELASYKCPTANELEEMYDEEEPEPTPARKKHHVKNNQPTKKPEVQPKAKPLNTSPADEYDETDAILDDLSDSVVIKPVRSI